MKTRSLIAPPATLVAVLLTVASTARAEEGGTAGAAPWLVRARAATGAEQPAGVTALRLGGTAEYLGRQGALEILLAPDGRFVRRIETSLPFTTGFDGSRFWTADWSGMPRELQLAERDWAEVTMALVTGRWVRPDFPWRITPAPESSEEAPALRLEKDGPGGPMTVWLDPATALPRRLTRRGISGETTCDLAEWTHVAGRAIPARIVEGTPGQEITLVADSIEPLASGALDTGAFNAPPEPGDFRFDLQLPADLEVKRAPTGHFLVKPKVNGRDLGWFIFDTGAGSSTISPATAQALELPVEGQGAVMSVLGYAPTHLYRARTLELGPLTIERPVFVEFDLTPFEGALGEKIAGVIGYDVMRRAVVELEAATSRIALHPRAGFDTTGLPWQALYLNDRHPIVAASFEGHEGLFKLDVGASGGPFGNVTMHAPAVERLGLIEGRELQPGHGPGMAYGHARFFELAGHRFESPMVMFATDRKAGPFQDPVTLGNIGLSFMQPFRILFDYADGRIALVEREGASG